MSSRPSSRESAWTFFWRAPLSCCWSPSSSKISSAGEHTMTQSLQWPPSVGVGDRLMAQLRFVLEIDKLKQVVRKTPLLDRSRPETDAEHSWEVALMAAVLAEHAKVPVDVGRVV